MGKRTIHNMDDLPTSVIKHLIDEWIHNKKYREILKLRLIDGETFEAISEMMDMSVPQIKTIVYTSIVRMYDCYNTKGET